MLLQDRASLVIGNVLHWLAMRRLIIPLSVIIAAVLPSIDLLAQANSEPQVFHLSPQAWVAIAGILISTGVNLQQVRQATGDVRKIAEKIDKIEDSAKDHGERLARIEGRMYGT